MATLILIGLIAGLITGISPCVLPMLPLVFFGGAALRGGSGAVAPTAAFGNGVRAATRTSSLRRPLLIVSGLVVSFAVFTLIGSAVLTALHLPQDFLRWTGLAMLTLVGLALLVPRLEELLQRPFRRLPRFSGRAGGGPFVLGLSLGTLYVPCAGPVLAVVSIAGITGRISGSVAVLTVAFSVGVAVPLFFFALAGQRISDRLAAHRSRVARLRTAGGLVMVLLAGALAFNLTDGLQRSIPSYTRSLQEKVEDNDAAKNVLAGVNSSGVSGTSAANAESVPTPSASLNAEKSAAASTSTTTPKAGSASPATGAVVSCKSAALTLANCGRAAELVGIQGWLNTPASHPRTVAGLRGKVVLVDFWTYSCINCQRTLPYVESWYEKYRASGLEVIGVHTPEFAFERVAKNVAGAIADQKVNFPVAMDNASRTWQNYRNSYWPAQYLIDADGILRHITAGEGGYTTSEALIRQLLTVANPGISLPPPIDPAVSIR